MIILAVSAVLIALGATMILVERILWQYRLRWLRRQDRAWEFEPHVISVPERQLLYVERLGL